MYDGQKNFNQAINSLAEKFCVKQDSKDDFLIMSKSYSPNQIDVKNFHIIYQESIKQKDIDQESIKQKDINQESIKKKDIDQECIKQTDINNILVKNYSENSSKDILDVFHKDSSAVFVDGGNTTLFESAGLSLGFIRIAALTYTLNKRTIKSLWEFYILARESEGIITVDTFPKNCFDSMKFNPEDTSLRNGLERADCSRIIPIIRRLAELNMACRSDSSKISLIVLDGTLEARYPYEKDFVDRLLLTGKAVALSKTCSLTLRSGIGIIKRLTDISENLPENKFREGWYYSGAVTSNNPLHMAEIFFVRLNRKSKHVFRLDVQKNFSRQLNYLMQMLSLNSSDPVFPGYPYGLIDADQHARISEQERQMLNLRMTVLLEKDKNKKMINNSLNSMNAHSILDRIKF